jgi:hypothetical protein
LKSNTYKFCLVAFLVSMFALTQFCSDAYAQPEDYKKWSRIAVDVVKLNYPDAQVSDYDYKGRKEISDTQAQDTFELQVKEENRTKSVNVYVTFNPKTNSLITVTMEEIKPTP